MQQLFLPRIAAIMLSFAIFSIAAYSQTQDSIKPATAPPTTATTLTTSSSVSTPNAPKLKKYSQELKIFLETRNTIARPEGYETLLTISEGGAMTFEWHTVSNKRKTLTAQLTAKEWKALRSTLNEKKFFEAELASRVGYADWMQSLAIEKDGKERTIRMMIDYRKRTPEAMLKNIQEQLGEQATKDLWQFIMAVRAANDRFKWSGQ